MSDHHKFDGSGNLGSGEYDPATQDMHITFASGAQYRYSGVPPETWDGLTSADSAGEFFHRHIRSRFATTRL